MQETATIRSGLKITTLKALRSDLIDGLLANYQKPEDLIGENGLLKQLTKALATILTKHHQVLLTAPHTSSASRKHSG